MQLEERMPSFLPYLKLFISTKDLCLGEVYNNKAVIKRDCSPSRQGLLTEENQTTICTPASGRTNGRPHSLEVVSSFTLSKTKDYSLGTNEWDLGWF